MKKVQVQQSSQTSHHKQWFEHSVDFLKKICGREGASMGKDDVQQKLLAY